MNSFPLNINFYRSHYDDVKNMNNLQIINFYNNIGKKEGRINSHNHAKFLTNNKLFDIDFYKSHYNDLHHMHPRQLVKHYNYKGKKEGRIVCAEQFKPNKKPDSHKFLKITLPMSKEQAKNLNIYQDIYNHSYFRKISYKSQLTNYRQKYNYRSKNIIPTKVPSKNLIVLYTPPLDIECGGIVVMHNLVKLINDLNHPNFYAKLFMNNNLQYDNQFCNEFAQWSDITDNTLVIYPEIVSGNPLGAKHVMRWILLNLGIEMPIDHYKKWNVNDLVYVWDNLYKKNQFIKTLCAPWLNPLYKNKNKYGLRKDTCFLVKKAKLYNNFNHSYFIHEKNSINLENLNLEEKVNLFNKCKYFYCYDLHTAYIPFAILCGCIPIIYPYKDYTKKSWLHGTMLYKNNILYDKGIAWGKSMSEINYAQTTLSEAANEIVSLYAKYNDEVKFFLEDINSYFENTSSLTNTVENIYY